MFKFHRFAAITLLLATSLGSWGAAPANDDSAWEKLKSFTHQQKTQAVAEGKKLIAATDKQMAALAKEVKNSTGEAKAEHQKNMVELKARKKEAQAQLNKLSRATSATWDATKEGFTNASKELQAAYGKAAAAVKK